MRRAIVLILVLLAGGDVARAQQSNDDRIRALIAQGEAFSALSARRYAEALAVYLEANRLADHTTDERLKANARFKMAQVYFNSDRAVEGLAAAQTAAALAKKAGALDIAGNAMRSMGSSLISLGRFSDAEAAFLEAVELSGRYGTADELARALNNLSVNAHYQGRLGPAIEYGRQTVELLDRSIADGVAISDQIQFSGPFNLGKVLAESGDYNESREHLERSFAAAERTSNIGAQMHVLFDTGEWYEAQGDLDRAERYFRRAIEFSAQHDSPEGEGKGRRGLGRVLFATSRFTDAVTELSTAAALFERHVLLFHLPPTLVELARARAAAGDGPGAERDLDRAILLSNTQNHRVGAVIALIERGRHRLAAGALSEAAADFDAATIRAQRDRLIPLVPSALAGRAAVSEGTGDPADALQAYEEAADALDRLRGQIVAVELRASFTAAAADIYRGMIRVLLTLHQNEPRGGYETRAFEALERERSQALDLAVVQARATATRGSAPPTEVRISEIQNALFAPGLTETNRTPLLRALDDAERDLTLASAAPLAVSPQPAATLQSLQLALDDREVVVEYATDVVFVVTRDRMRTVRLVAAPDLDSRVNFFVRALETNARSASITSGRALAATLIDPLLPLIPAGARLLIVASGPIARVPFAALPIESPSGAVPLLARHEISYLPSLTLFEARRSGVASSIDRRVLAVADAAASSARARSLAPLPASRAEVQFVAGLMPDARVMIAGEATEQAIKLAAADSYPVLHLATHALLDSNVPDRSAILLGASSGEDGLLQSREIYQLPLRGSLIVLSGCRTADGHLTGADGLRSLARAFLQAGGRTVVGSLWDLPDRTTAEIVQAFYTGLNGTHSAGSALRNAQLAVAGADPYANTRDWAAMVMLGDPSTTLAERPQNYAAWLPLLTMLLMVGWLAVTRRRATPLL